MGHETVLKQMFPKELSTCYVYGESSSRSYNDGGNIVTTLWKCVNSGVFYRTRYNDWSIRHPDTTCHKVRKREELVVHWENC